MIRASFHDAALSDSKQALFLATSCYIVCHIMSCCCPDRGNSVLHRALIRRIYTLNAAQDPASEEVDSGGTRREGRSLRSVKESMYEEEGCLQAPQLDDDMEAMNPCDPLLTSAMMERDRDIHYLQPACNIKSHRELLKRAEAAELRCQALEASLLLEKQVAEQQADALQTAIQQVQTAEVQFLLPLSPLHIFLCLISQMPSHHCRWFLIAQHQRISLQKTAI